MSDDARSTFLKNRAADLRKTQLETLRQSMQLTDRILSGRDNVDLRFAETKPDGSTMNHAYAITAGSTITINPEKVGNVTSAEGIASMLGLNYHEFAHLMLTPADRTIMSNHLKGQSMNRLFWQAYAILEEHRIETIMGARFPSMRKYFAYPILSLMLADISSGNMATKHLLIHGRRFLPRKLRDTFRKAFEGAYNQTAAREAEECIDKFRVLALTNPAAYQEGALLINRFAKLMADLGIEPPMPQHGESGGSPNKGDKKKDRQDQEKAAKQAKSETEKQDEQEKQDSEHDGSKGEKNEEKGDGNDDDESGSQGSDSGGEGDGGSDSEDGESEDSGSGGSSQDKGSGDRPGGKGSGKDSSGNDDQSSSGDSKPGKGGADGSQKRGGDGQNKSKSSGPTVGTGAGSSDQIDKTPPKTYNNSLDVRAAAREMMKEVLEDDEVRSDINKYKQAMDQSRDGLKALLMPTPEKNEKYFRPVTPEMFSRSGAVANELRQIWAKMESGWDYGVEDGARLNMQNASLATEPEDYESIYDDWVPGQQDNAGLEVVIMGDRSGSMCDKVLPKGWDPNRARSMTSDEWAKIPSLATVVSQNIWELMHALQEVEAKVTVITYDHLCYTFYARNETVNGNGWYELIADGGTNPLEGFKEARRILTQSEMPNKLLINFTDGGWGGNEQQYAEILDPMWDVTKVASLIGGFTPEKFRFSKLFDVVRATSGDILEVMSDAVTDLLRRSAGN